VTAEFLLGLRVLAALDLRFDINDEPADKASTSGLATGAVYLDALLKEYQSE
jgi:hypothetical protein